MAAMAMRERVFEALAQAIWGGSLTPELIDEAYRVTDVILDAINQTGDGAATPGQGLGGSTSEAAAPSSVPRSFQLIRHVDVTGVSGTGLIGEGTQFRDGTTVFRWYGDHPSTVVWPSPDDIVAVHGHQGATELVWLDESVPYWPADEGDRRDDDN